MVHTREAKEHLIGLCGHYLYPRERGLWQLQIATLTVAGHRCS